MQQQGKDWRIIMKHSTKIILLLLTLSICIGLIGCFPLEDLAGKEVASPVESSDLLTVHFIDVGQGDSILIQTSEGQNMLIDAGSNSKGDVVKEYLQEQGVNKVDILIGTHPHEDHIGGLDVVIDNFDIGLIYMPKVAHTTKTYEDLLLAVQRKGLKIKSTAAGMDIPLEGVDAQILAPEPNLKSDNLNDYSIVIRLTHGNISFLFQGDAEKRSEKHILDKEIDIEADLIKLGHHGSSTSSSPKYIKAVKPSYAIITVGKDNKYGHPHVETMELMDQLGIIVYRTDEDGTIVAISDGERLSFSTR